MNSTPRRRRRGGPDQPPLWLIYGLLLLPVALLVCFNYVPAVSALYHAFTEWDVGGESDWVGLRNFVELARDSVFLKSMANLMKLGTFMIIAHLSMPFIVAEMIFHLKSERASYWSRVAVVLPMIIPMVIVYLLWRYIYSDAGPLTEFLLVLGLDEWVRGWLSDPATALWAVAFVGFPFALGVNVLIFYAGLAKIPGSVLEAADLDGLGPLGRIFRIHIPLVLAEGKLLLILTVIAVINGFELLYVLTLDGGPGYETMVPGLYMYLNGWSYNRMGYASAIGLLMLIFLLLFTLALNRFVRTEGYDPGAR